MTLGPWLMAFEPGSELEGAHKLKMVYVDRTSEEDDGRVGEATGGERGGGPTVRAALGGADVSGVDVGEGVGSGKRDNLLG